jgi:EpsI family protein
MTTKRLVLLLLVMVLGLSAVFLLPAAGKSQPVGIKLELPQLVGGWYGVDQKISERELQILAADTEFARKRYTRTATGDTIWVSIVLSGLDLDNSIHRPERCLPAQGVTIADSRKVDIPLGEGARSLKVTRLHNVRSVQTNDGKVFALYSLNYYWFVGYHHLTASNLQRTFLDMRDRVLKGYNQRWAYITVAADVTEGIFQNGRSEKETDNIIQNFVRDLFPKISAEANEPVFSKRETQSAQRPL